ncbi:hypothetical protein [Oceanicaulis alexandrii]|uniref:hypothetical protein n=1 Tax=Oceanicaulis alexandrii TaxID=153233 RepID=UPI0003B3A2F8|nr:hypothetical protein [Oceanicaulis alexandrii]
MSLSELFSLRYRARVGSGELFAADLHLHDRRALEEKAKALNYTEDEVENALVDAELALRIQLAKTINNANEKRKIKDLPRRARQIMADAYLQANRAHWSAVLDAPGFENLFQAEGGVSARDPLNGKKWSIAANLMIFDYVEAFFDLLPGEEQLEFSRDLNQRLQRGESRWYFQLGRWRRDDWPRERDSQFDQILYSLKSQADQALTAQDNKIRNGETVTAQTLDPQKVSASLSEAARSLWEADRLLESDLLSKKVRHGAAVRAARHALDQCLVHFRGKLDGPFVKAKPPKDKRPGKGLGRLAAPTLDKSALKGVSEGVAAAIRIEMIGKWLAHGGGLKDQRLNALDRAGLAEMLLRLVLFGLPEDKDSPYDIEEAEADEIRSYSKITAVRDVPKRDGKLLNHGEGSLMLHMDDEASARLAVDVLARLCQFATGAAGSPKDAAEMRADQPIRKNLGAPLETRRAPNPIWLQMTNWLILGGVAASLIGLGFIFGLLTAGWSPAFLSP